MLTKEEKKELRKRLKELIVVGENGCWTWIGGRAYNSKSPSKTYGVLSLKGKRHSVRTLAWMAWKTGEVPESIINVTCGNSLCINPSHLKKGYQKRSPGRRGAEKRQALL